MALTRKAFLEYRKLNKGGTSKVAFEIWVKNGGKDNDGYVFVEKLKPKNQKKKQKKSKLSIKKNL